MTDRLEALFEAEKKRTGRPEILDGPLPIYEHDWSVIPEKVRICFADGHTAVYALQTDLPHPLVMKNIEIMKETKKKIGYINQPQRRRRKP